MVQIIKQIVTPDRYNLKCPFERTPSRIVIHNTANDAPAKNEISYMRNNNYEVSYHFAVDDNEAVQGLPLERNAWASGDSRGKGNMEGIHIEICYSLTGGERFIRAEENAAELTAYLLNKYGWNIDKVTKHQDYDGKYCPHRTLDMGWQRFLDMIKKYMEDEEMTQEKFNEMMGIYEAEKAKKAESKWSKKEGYWKKACDKKIFDGTAPQGAITREQTAAVLGRLGLIK